MSGTLDKMNRMEKLLTEIKAASINANPNKAKVEPDKESEFDEDDPFK